MNNIPDRETCSSAQVRFVYGTYGTVAWRLMKEITEDVLQTLKQDMNG